MLYDLAVLRIRGNLEVSPQSFTAMSDQYTAVQKHPAVSSIAALFLPQAVELFDRSTLISGITMVTVFGWFAPRDETTLYVPQAHKVAATRRGYIETQALLHAAGSGGGQFDAHGRLVAVNSKSDDPPVPSLNSNAKRYVAYGRLVSELLPDHGFSYDIPVPAA